jgi:hypothetical protein
MIVALQNIGAIKIITVDSYLSGLSSVPHGRVRILLSTARPDVGI